jgi:nucleoside-diphosphate-sugar epimerase
MDEYRGQKVLITGGLGFIGSNLAIRLVKLGANVTLLDSIHPTCGANYFNIEPIKNDVESWATAVISNCCASWFAGKATFSIWQGT